MSDTHHPGRSSIDDSPVSGDDEIVEPDQGNGTSSLLLYPHLSGPSPTQPFRFK